MTARQTADEAAERVNALADAYMEAWSGHRLDFAVYYGVPLTRHDALPDNSLSGVAAWRTREDELHAGLLEVDAGALDGRPERVTYGLLREELEAGLRVRVCRPELWGVDQVNGWHTFYPLVAETQPVGTDDLRAQALARWRAFPRFIAAEVEKLREGLRLGFTAAQDNVRRVVDQVEGMCSGPVDESPFFDPARRDEDPEFRRAWEALVAEEIDPALRRFAGFLRSEYLPRARATVGMSSLPSGAEGYRAMLRGWTSLEVDPDEAHRTALAELARAEAAISPVAARVLGTADVAEARRLLRSAEHRYRDGEEMVALAAAAVERARAALPRWFNRIPAADVVVERCAEYMQASAPGGVFVPPAEGRAGKYVLNPHRAAEAVRIRGEGVAFHETLPGHHLQLALARERPGAHPLARCFGNSGFVEGWAVYAERVADEMGLYSSDLDRLGVLFGRAYYAATLVTDTGMHHHGWTRDRARGFLLEHSLAATALIENGVDMQAALPGQAACYLLGCLEMERLRARAVETLGPRFDVRAFHDRVLEDGSVTLPMLREKVERWIAGGR